MLLTEVKVETDVGLFRVPTYRSLDWSVLVETRETALEEELGFTGRGVGTYLVLKLIKVWFKNMICSSFT